MQIMTVKEFNGKRRNDILRNGVSVNYNLLMYMNGRGCFMNSGYVGVINRCSFWRKTKREVKEEIERRIIETL